MVIEGQCHCGRVRWQIDGPVDRATACNCTMCRRSGALWAYGFDLENIRVTAAEGDQTAYVHGDRTLALMFCRTCGNVTHWRAVEPGADGRRRAAVNLRMAEPAAVAAVAIHHFDGLDRWESLPDDGRRVADLWF